VPADRLLRRHPRRRRPRLRCTSKPHRPIIELHSMDRQHQDSAGAAVNEGTLLSPKLYLLHSIDEVL
jgi:hypothetical protein